MPMAASASRDPAAARRRPATAASSSSKFAAEPDAAGLRPFVHALQAIVAGSRDRTLADAPGLDYTMAAEILLLIETLETAGV